MNTNVNDIVEVLNAVTAASAAQPTESVFRYVDISMAQAVVVCFLLLIIGIIYVVGRATNLAKEKITSVKVHKTVEVGVKDS